MRWVFLKGAKMRERANVKLLLSMVVILAGAAGTTTGQMVFRDDFSGDGAKTRFVMEAENYSRRSSGAGADWLEVDGSTNRFIEGPNVGQTAPTAESGARGNYLETVGKQIGNVAPVDKSYNGPFVDYKVLVETPGKYRLYVRWTARDIYSDSLYAFILKPNGTLLTGAGPNYFMYHQCRPKWIWDNRGVKNTTRCGFAGFPDCAVWRISQPGCYTVRIALREKGMALDALVLQTANLEAPSGSGAIESLRLPETTKLGSRAVITVNNIRGAIAEKVKLLEEIDAGLERDWRAYEGLEIMSDSGEYAGLSYSGLTTARREIFSAMEHQKRARAALEKSVANLKDALRQLGFKLAPGK